MTEESEQFVLAPSRARYIAGILLRLRSPDVPIALLDVGCGTGRLLKAIDNRRATWYLYGIDSDPEKYEYASNHRPYARIKQGSVLDLPYDDFLFDVVVCSDVLEHLSYAEHERACAELRRVVAPGGVLIVSSPVGDQSSGMQKKLGHVSVLCPEYVSALIGAVSAETHTIVKKVNQGATFIVVYDFQSTTARRDPFQTS